MPSDEPLTSLVRLVREHRAASAPGWTDTNEPDPGVTLLELLSYVIEQIDSRAAKLPPDARRRLATLGTRLVELGRSDEPIDVDVNGESWTAVPTLAGAASDANVYSLDRERGEVRFGDGVNGRRPPDGARVTATYRSGAGQGDTRVAVETRWPLPDATWTVRAHRQGWLVVASDAADPAEQGSGVLERNRFFAGRLLTADDFDVEQAYVRTKLRRAQRASLGIGVVSGLGVTVQASDDGTQAIVLSPGMAVDREGELIEVAGDVSCPIPAGDAPLFVLLRYVERPSHFTPTVGLGSEESATQPTRIAEGFAVSVATDSDDAAVVLARIVREGTGWKVEGAA